MDHDHGDPVTAWHIFWTSDLPFHRRLAVTAGNVIRRFRTWPPSECCGRPGEPGC
jgi:hypothetical protein